MERQGAVDPWKALSCNIHMNELPLIDAAYPEQIQDTRSLLWPAEWYPHIHMYMNAHTYIHI